MGRESSVRFDPTGARARSLTTPSRAPYVVTGCRKDATRRLKSAGRRLWEDEDTSTTTSRSASALFARARRTFCDRLTLGRSSIHGYGLVAKRPHAAGELICEYVGELVREVVADFRERDVFDVENERGSTFIFALDERWRIDATRAGNLARLANHSCEPNARAERVHRAGASRVCLFALREIAPGEEVTYDYDLDASETLPCRCGARRCRGFVNASLVRRLRSSA